MGNIIGLIFYIIVIILILFLVLFRVGRLKDKLLRTHIFLIGYFSFSTILFVIIQRLSAEILKGNFKSLANQNYQISFLILAIGVAFQIIFIILNKDLFYKIALPSIINIFSLFGILYFLGFGIINATWFMIYTGVFAGFILVTTIYNSLEPIIKDALDMNDDLLEQRNNILDMIKDELNRYLKLGFQGIFALGASLGASMAILFTDGAKSWSDPYYLIDAFSMVFAFGTVGLGFLIWIIKPYLENYTKVRHFYKKK